MTAVEWLIQQIDNKDMGEIPMWVYDFCNDALEMERNQKLDAHEKGYMSGFGEARKYYFETYKKSNK